MFKASDARQLVKQSKEVMTVFLDRIGEKIKEKAALGKSSLYLDWDVGQQIDSEVSEVKTEHYCPADFTPLQRLYKAELEKAGYGVTIAVEHHDGKACFGRPEDIEPYVSHHIKVSW